MRHGVRVGATVAIVIVAGVLLAGCTSPGAESPPSSAPPSASEASPAETAAPVLLPSGTAEENLPYFDLVNTQTLEANPESDGRAFIDGLVAAGFDKTAMEVTLDATTIGNPADSIQFSVKMGESCLIGQHGSAVGGYHSAVGRVLGTGTCLIGKTRTIDW